MTFDWLKPYLFSKMVLVGLSSVFLVVIGVSLVSVKSHSPTATTSVSLVMIQHSLLNTEHQLNELTLQIHQQDHPSQPLLHTILQQQATILAAIQTLKVNSLSPATIQSLLSQLSTITTQLKQSAVSLSLHTTPDSLTVDALPFKVKGIERWNQQLFVRVVDAQGTAALLAEGDHQGDWQLITINAQAQELRWMNHQQQTVQQFLNNALPSLRP